MRKRTGWFTWPPPQLMLLLAAASMTVNAKYSVPADAISIGAEELTADKLTDHLKELMGNSSFTSEENSVDDRHIPKALMRLDTLLRSAEERKKRLETSARLLSINRGGFFRGLLIVWVPVSFLLPTLSRKPSYYRREWDTSSRSSDGQSGGHSRNLLDNEASYDPDTADYAFDPNYGPLLSRLDGYFGLLRVKDPACRLKLLCHAARTPDELQPLSNLFRRVFERSESFTRPSHYHAALKKFFTYLWADKKGRRFSSPSQCDQEYHSCSPPVHQLIRTDMLLFWQTLSRRFAIQLQDE